MGVQTIEQKLVAATAAVSAVKAKLRYGAGNRADDRQRTYEREHTNAERMARNLGYGPGSVWLAGQMTRYIAELKVISMRIDDFFGKLGSSHGVQRIRDVANQATRFGAGNCADQACVAFMELFGQSVRPIDIMFLTNSKHAFVLIGKESGTSVDPETWGSGVVVCDPWNNDAYHLESRFAKTTLLQKMQCGCATASSQFRVD